MEFKGNSQQPAASNTNNRVSQPQPMPRAGGEGNSFKMVTRDDGGKKKVMVIAVVVVVILVVAGLGWWLWGRMTGADKVNGNEYQAVFLTNGQVYFGKLSNPNSDYISLDDIYYLQVQSSVQPDANKSSDQNPQVSLAKLGSELHGPEDHMAINKSQVLFWENLKDSGKVVQAIKSNQQQK